MVEGLRKNCGRYKNSQTKYTPLLQMYTHKTSKIDFLKTVYRDKQYQEICKQTKRKVFTDRPELG